MLSSLLLQPGVVPVCSALRDVLIFTFGEALSNLSLSCVLSCEGTSPASTMPTSARIADVVIVKELVFVLLEDGRVCILTICLWLLDAAILVVISVFMGFHGRCSYNLLILAWGTL